MLFECALLDIYFEMHRKWLTCCFVPCRSTVKSSNVSLNWTWGDQGPELVQCQTGKCEDSIPSRLCKQLMMDSFLTLWDRLAGEEEKKLVISKGILPVIKSQKVEHPSPSALGSKIIAGKLPFSQDFRKKGEKLSVQPSSGSGSDVDPKVVTALELRKNCTYAQLKSLSPGYNQSKEALFESYRMNCGHPWLKKPPEMDRFCL